MWEYLLHTNRGIRRTRFLLATMWALPPGSAHARPSAQAPIDTSGIFLRQLFFFWMTLA